MERKRRCFKKLFFIVLVVIFMPIILYFSFYHFEEKSAVYQFEELIERKNVAKTRMIKIAIIDSGINDHDELDGKVVKRFHAIHGASKTFDGYNHGTPIAGIIAGNTVGVNPHVQLYDVQFLNEEGTGNVEHLVKGIDWAIAEDVDIINLSFGFQQSNAQLEEVIKKANNNHILVIAAAGNTFGFGVDYPAKYPNVLSIGAVNEKLSKAYFSGEGKVDFVTLGTNIKSITNTGDDDAFDGTSFATAYFTGLVSLLMSKFANKEEAYTFVHQQLKNYTHDLGDEGFDNKYGNGLILLTK